MNQAKKNEVAQRCVRFPARLVAGFLLPFILPGTLSAQRSGEVELFVKATSIRAPTATAADKRVLRTRWADVNLDGLAAQAGRAADRSTAGGKIRLNLFDDTSFIAVPDRVEVTGPGRFSWTGHLEGVEPSEVTLAVADRILAGNITMPGASFHVRYEETRVYSIKGTNLGGNQLYSQSRGTSLSGTVSGLPVNGSTLYVRLWSKISAVWQFNDYVFIAASP